jgi:hypothetical protein
LTPPHSKNPPAIAEKDWQAQVVQLAGTFGWMVQHTRVSMVGDRYMTAITGNVGFPDLVLAHRTKGVLFVELKTETGRMATAQTEWRDTLAGHVEWYLWRPSDIAAVMRRLSRAV